MDDLNAGVGATKTALKSSPPDHPNRLIYLTGLGIAIGLRFELT
jgi:hypothetical protein